MHGRGRFDPVDHVERQRDRPRGDLRRREPHRRQRRAELTQASAAVETLQRNIDRLFIVILRVLARSIDRWIAGVGSLSA